MYGYCTVRCQPGGEGFACFTGTLVDISNNRDLTSCGQPFSSAIRRLPDAGVGNVRDKRLAHHRAVSANPVLPAGWPCVWGDILHQLRGLSWGTHTMTTDNHHTFQLQLRLTLSECRLRVNGIRRDKNGIKIAFIDMFPLFISDIIDCLIRR